MSTRPEACVVVEESRYGVEAARAAGMDVLAYDAGLIDPRLLAGERTVVFSDMHALPGIVNEMRGRVR
jgi:beta-phosphoglucomutase-like phosphatase (HAD superfamily)